MGAVGSVVGKLRSRATDRRLRRKRSALMARIGELTFAQRTDPSAAYGAEIESLVEEVRHLERQIELRRRRDIAGGEQP